MAKGILLDWLKRTNKLERIWLLAKIEFKLRYYENRLGLLWALIKPIMDICIYYVVFQIIKATFLHLLHIYSYWPHTF